MANPQTDGSRERSAEITQLNHELEILRERRVSYQRNERVAKTFYACFSVVVLSGAAIISFKDPATGLFIAGGLVVICLIALFWYSLDHHKQRIVATLFNAMLGVRTVDRSDGQIIEDQVAERERRLAELTAES